MRREIRLAGNGGQGLILGGIILAEAAGLFDGKQVVQSQVYGPESRGGASRADVIIDEVEIDYPKATAPEALLVMSMDAWRKFGQAVRPGGLVLYDSDLVDTEPVPGVQLVDLPLTAIARAELGRAIVANVVGLSALTALTGVVSRQALERAVRRRAPKGSEALNERAVAAGWQLAAATRTLTGGVRP